ncbi:endonuclease/exonuclease/phosphatase family protein [Salinibacterium hongtaonis]|uniref:endonuclease/exonuclease/phosphatase family protein n=1 Tax=Homoserinimonas hongtaonis TaxID=2079791 RepID=UPI000D376AAD|nr:endonuclease/exonuclease/phosphatase family protein [Salinibacterium hongtaonis]AWB89193.1 hydrolase [Salinibacterium hongtaonis]
MVMLTRRVGGDRPLIGPVGAPYLHVMSYNVRRIITMSRHGSPDFWPVRRDLVERMLHAERPTILGTQEAMASQARAIAGMMGPDFRIVGHGRAADGKGEGCPIYFDATRLTLIDWSQRTLSPTPHAAGSRGWGNLVPRVVVTAEFDDMMTGKRFVVFNTHFDHTSKRSRVASAEYVASLVSKCKHPVILMGDFNTVPGKPPYRILVNAGLRDSLLVADKRLGGAGPTFSDYKLPSPRGRRIDWLMVSDRIDVKVGAINTARFEGRAASDHEPVQAVIDVL